MVDQPKRHKTALEVLEEGSLPLEFTLLCKDEEVLFFGKTIPDDLQGVSTLWEGWKLVSTFMPPQPGNFVVIDVPGFTGGIIFKALQIDYVDDWKEGTQLTLKGEVRIPKKMEPIQIQTWGENRLIVAIPGIGSGG